MVNTMASKLGIGFFLLFLHVGISTGFENSYVDSKCVGNATKSYDLNVRVLLSGLAKVAVQDSRNYYAMNISALRDGREVIVYGAYLCRGDVHGSECGMCVSNAISDLYIQCKKSKGVTWYESCMVRYSDDNFVGKMSGDENIYKSKKKKVLTDKKAYLNLAGSLLQNMSMEFNSQTDILNSTTTMFFGYRLARLSDSYVTVYGMAQCTPDLTPYDCQTCLQILTEDIIAQCSGSLGCWLLNPACFARYDDYPFSKLPINSPSPPPADHHYRRPTNFKRKRSLVLRIVIPSSIGLAILVVSLLIYLHRKRREAITYEDLDGFSGLKSMRLSFSTVKKATHNFAEENKLGQGGFGEVYKGKLPNGEEVAIKRLARNSKQGINEFKNEILLLARLQHKNLVKLIGFCESKSEKILIYEFIPNSSLDRILFGSRRAILEWGSRFQIIMGVAKAILYLHEDSRLKIIHRDLKPSNILLDNQMNPKVADLGLAKLFKDDQSQSNTNTIPGTPGYMAPEYARGGNISTKSDMYSLGVVILEIVSGQRNGFSDQRLNEEGLIPRAWRLWTEQAVLDLVDPLLLAYSQEQVRLCIRIALLCIQQEPNERPTMMSVVAALSGDTATTLSVPTVPLCFAPAPSTEPTTGPTMASILAALREESELVPEIQPASD